MKVEVEEGDLQVPAFAMLTMRFSVNRKVFESMESKRAGLHFCSGIGLALCDRLLSEDGRLRLCLACRNMKRAEAARAALLACHAGARVDLLCLDVGSARSVLSAAEELKAR